MDSSVHALRYYNKRIICKEVLQLTCITTTRAERALSKTYKMINFSQELCTTKTKIAEIRICTTAVHNN